MLRPQTHTDIHSRNRGLQSSILCSCHDGFPTYCLVLLYVFGNVHGHLSVIRIQCRIWKNLYSLIAILILYGRERHEFGPIDQDPVETEGRWRCVPGDRRQTMIGSPGRLGYRAIAIRADLMVLHSARNCRSFCGCKGRRSGVMIIWQRNGKICHIDGKENGRACGSFSHRPGFA